jgi:hypothetical protein
MPKHSGRSRNALRVSSDPSRSPRSDRLVLVLNGSAPKLSVPLTTWELTRDIDAIIALSTAVERAEDKPEPVQLLGWL